MPSPASLWTPLVCLPLTRPLPSSGQYQVTEMAEGLVRLMHETLAEACASRSAAVVQLGVGAVRDVAALLVALPPVTRPKELQARSGR